MREIDEFLKYSNLFNIYKDLLSNKQKEYMSAFFEEDNSFSEIAEALNISRQAVFENIKKGCIKLDFFEEKLGILKKEEEYINMLEDLDKNFSRENLTKIISKVKGY
ncbi:YlxM family DNA-binding protein [Oceanivirga miroungae]|uniref:UPF0122 protein OMES3154_00772 n=1 Tax=Oceanivirga miroungae TaxID=1130046 RepID=A0A6I8M7V5_9FUSO|nr:DNA-binding protein [Oceanivirga miroungae]VWL85487.1 helix-turn-helix protein YlxM/p13 family protein [Oceanivirga miroungae]